jgi:hypothetical protein
MELVCLVILNVLLVLCQMIELHAKPVYPHLVNSYMEESLHLTVVIIHAKTVYKLEIYQLNVRPAKKDLL